MVEGLITEPSMEDGIPLLHGMLFWIEKADSRKSPAMKVSSSTDWTSKVREKDGILSLLSSFVPTWQSCFALFFCYLCVALFFFFFLHTYKMRRSRNAESLVDNAPPDTITRSKLNFKIESNAGFSFNRSTFEVESSQSISRPEISSVKPSAVKKKRGRPRKYGSVSVLPLAPPHERSKRGRPPKAASLGKIFFIIFFSLIKFDQCVTVFWVWLTGE